MDETVQSALEQQRRGFETKYATLYRSRTFWLRTALVEGAVLAIGTAIIVSSR